MIFSKAGRQRERERKYKRKRARASYSLKICHKSSEYNRPVVSHTIITNKAREKRVYLVTITLSINADYLKSMKTLFFSAIDI